VPVMRPSCGGGGGGHDRKPPPKVTSRHHKGTHNGVQSLFWALFIKQRPKYEISWKHSGKTKLVVSQDFSGDQLCEKCPASVTIISDDKGRQSPKC
jgi:hypothetical protein